MQLAINNVSGHHIWLTLKQDFYRNVILISLYPRQPPLAPGIELYEDLLDGQYLRLSRPEWTDTTRITFDDSEFSPKLTRQTQEGEDDEGKVWIFTFKITNGAH